MILITHIEIIEIRKLKQILFDKGKQLLSISYIDKKFTKFSKIIFKLIKS